MHSTHSQGATKVPFRVVYSTGWEDEYPVKDLEVHSPFVKGWRSPRFCLYPQEIVVKIDPPGRIRKLQLLSHQHLIASVVELYVGHYGGHTSFDHTSLDHAKFKRLGYVSLADNEYQFMELKSVNVDCVGELVKLVFRHNHINRLNIYNQVGIVAINVIAEPIPMARHPRGPSGLPIGVLDLIQKSTTNARLASLLHTYLPGINQSDTGSTNPVLKGKIKPAKVSAMDDLSFAVGQDPETADIVRKLERRKAAAIDEENFREAKRLKMVVDELCKAGKLLCRYQVEKKEAIDREDYDTAKSKKEKLDEARKLIYQELDVHGLLDVGKRPTFSEQPHHQHHHHTPVSLPPVRSRELVDRASDRATTNAQRLQSLEERDHSPFLPPIHQDSRSSRPPSRSKPPVEATADDRPLPALVKMSGDLEALPDVEEGVPLQGAEAGGEETDAAEEGDQDIKTEPLSEKQINQVSLAVETFGMEVCEQLYAKQYSLRERGLSSIQQHLASQPEALSRKETSSLLKSLCQTLVKGFSDKVFSTFTRSQELLEYVLEGFAQNHSLSNQDFTLIVERVAPALIVKTGDLSPRIQEASLDLLTQLSRHSRIKGLTLFGPMLLEPFKAKIPSWRLIKSRVMLLERLKEEPGFTPASGLTVKKVMSFIVGFLDHSSGEVRDTVIRLILALYRMNGTEVRSLMPVPDTVAYRRKKLWKTVFEGFDKIDGVPSPAEREAMSKAAEKAKNEEILKLQKQVEVMKTMVSSAGNAAGASGNHLTTGEHSATGENNTIDKMCVFCGKHQEDLQSEAAIEQHYLEECPMLQPCPHCHQVIEISGLTKHWLTECEFKAKFRKCPLCKDAILTNQFDGHVEAGNCQGQAPPGDDGVGLNRCPLCHQNIPAGDEGWRVHLMGPAGHPDTCPHRKKATNTPLSQHPSPEPQPPHLSPPSPAASHLPSPPT